MKYKSSNNHSENADNCAALVYWTAASQITWFTRVRWSNTCSDASQRHTSLSAALGQLYDYKVRRTIRTREYDGVALRRMVWRLRSLSVWLF